MPIGSIDSMVTKTHIFLGYWDAAYASGGIYSGWEILFLIEQ